MTTNRAQVPAAAGVSAGARLPLSATERTRHRRLWHLGRADRESLHAVLRAGLVAHLGVIIDGWPMVIPTVYGFDADTLYLHGSVASRSLNTAGADVCVTITLCDWLVLARSVFEHTINYRCAMIYGQPRVVNDAAEKLAGLRFLAEHVPPDDGASPDAALGLWAGELPLATTWRQPVPDPALPPGILVPAHIRARAGTHADVPRSEEHTSELQSRSDLVCRLLLEKKKNKKTFLVMIKKKNKKNSQTKF